MDEEQVQDPSRMMRSLALTAGGEFLLFVGIVFALLGIARFLTGLIGIEGSGDFAVGIALIIIGSFLLSRLKVAAPPQRIEEKKGSARSEAYR